MTNMDSIKFKLHQKYCICKVRQQKFVHMVWQAKKPNSSRHWILIDFILKEKKVNIQKT